jgi:hypothetical protein
MTQHNILLVKRALGQLPEDGIRRYLAHRESGGQVLVIGAVYQLGLG